MSGCFITFEGICKSGKTTQSKLLAERLKSEGHDVLLTHEPGGTPIGEDIRAVVLNPIHLGMSRLAELFLFMASRAQHVEEVVRPHLHRAGVVLCDRFSDSTLAYQGHGRGIALDTIRQLNRIAVAGCEPDLTFLLDIPLDLMLERQAQLVPDRMENESTGGLGSATTRGRSGGPRDADQLALFGVAFHAKVREGYLELAREHPDRIHTIDGTRAVATVAQEIYPIVMARLAQLGARP